MESGTVAQERRPDPASWLLRAGLAFVFMYAGMSMMCRPEAFEKYLPGGLHGGAATTAFLYGVAVYEVALAVSFLTGRHQYPASVAAAITLVVITASNLAAFDVVFRNVAIACAAASLAVQSRPGHASEARRACPSCRPEQRPELTVVGHI